MNGVLRHAGLFAFGAGGLLLWFFPLDDGGILPDPWETLFDWGGEVVSMSYLAVMFGLCNLAPAALLAGLLDRCAWWHTSLAMLIVVVTASILLHSGFAPLNAAICGTVLSVLLAAIYAAGRGLRMVIARGIRRLKT